MIDAWLNMSEAGVFGVLAVFYGGTGLLLALQPLAMPWRRAVLSLTGVVAPYFASIALLFGLSFGFLAAEVAQRNRLAWTAVVSEGNALMTVGALAGPSGPVAAAVARYAAAAKAEWPAMAEGRASVAAAEAMAGLLTAASDPAVTAAHGATAAGAMVAAAGRVATARSDRLSLAIDRTHGMKWAVVLGLGVLTQVGLLLVHLDKPRALAVALSVFSLAAVVALGLVAVQELPFSGAVQVSPDLLSPLAGAPLIGG